eukprot:TRINITY_DN36392_c0_g1_i3.p1 TRINITY_DN36392_c0_g1~~TRINITY_DN36392_c0_g1_i3.p1  ORF type:complete len:201 (+),score=47.93 TRINITY_DN36392_c0_g1_i3:32-604(+)
MPRLHRLCVDAPLAFLHGQPGAGCEGDGHAASFTPSQPSGLHRRHVPVTAFAKDATAAAKDTTAAAKEGEDAKKEGKEGEEEEDPLVTRKPHDTADAVDIYIHNKMGLMFGGGNINKVYDLIDESRLMTLKQMQEPLQLSQKRLQAEDPRLRRWMPRVRCSFLLCFLQEEVKLPAHSPPSYQALLRWWAV